MEVYYMVEKPKCSRLMFCVICNVSDLCELE